MTDLLEELKLAWKQFDLDALERLEPLYHPDVVFIEPAGEIRGRDSLFRYFRASCSDLLECRFEFDPIMETRSSQNGQGFLVWHMHFRHRRLARGKPISVAGTTLLKFDDQITCHRDWFDLGAAIYEHLPVLGTAVRAVKRRVQH